MKQYFSEEEGRAQVGMLDNGVDTRILVSHIFGHQGVFYGVMEHEVSFPRGCVRLPYQIEGIAPFSGKNADLKAINSKI